MLNRGAKKMATNMIRRIENRLVSHKRLVVYSLLCPTVYASTMGMALAIDGSDMQATKVQDLPTYIVTASRYEEAETDIPLDTSSYTREELEQHGATTVAEAFRYIPGAIVSGFGNHDQSWITGNTEVVLRGVQGGTLVLLNGVPVSFNGVTHLDMIPMNVVDRVEVMKGSGSIMYGSSAYGGVINVITKKQLDNTAFTKVGNNGRFMVGGTIDAGPLGIALQHDESDGMVPSTKGIAGTRMVPNQVGVLQRTPFDTAFGDSKKRMMALTYQINPRLSALYLHTQKKYFTEYVKDVDNSQGIQHFNYDDREDFAILNYNHKDWEGKAYYQKRSIRNPDYYFANPTVMEWERSKQHVYGADVSHKWMAENDKFILGASVRRETYEDVNQKYASFGNALSALRPVAHFGQYTLTDYALYGQWQHYYGSRWETILSGRAEKVKGDKTSITEVLPQFQVLYRLNNTATVYGNVGKTFRMPTFRNLYYSSGALLANPNLEPESGWNYELGYKHIARDKEFRAALFYTKLNNQIANRTVAGRTQAYNASKYKNHGIDISYQQNLKNGWYYRVGGILNKPQRKDNATSPWKDVLGKYQVSAMIGYKADKFDVSMQTVYYGGRVYYGTQDKKDAMWQTSIHGKYKVNSQLNLTLDVNNLFNREDITNSDNGTIDYLVGRRSFILGANYKF